MSGCGSGRCASSAADVASAPGELVVGKAGVLVGTGSYAVSLGDVVPQGKRPMDAASWARGVRPTPDDRLGA